MDGLMDVKILSCGFFNENYGLIKSMLFSLVFLSMNQSSLIHPSIVQC